MPILFSAVTILSSVWCNLCSAVIKLLEPALPLIAKGFLSKGVGDGVLTASVVGVIIGVGIVVTAGLVLGVGEMVGLGVGVLSVLTVGIALGVIVGVRTGVGAGSDPT